MRLPILFVFRWTGNTSCPSNPMARLSLLLRWRLQQVALRPLPRALRKGAASHARISFVSIGTALVKSGQGVGALGSSGTRIPSLAPCKMLCFVERINRLDKIMSFWCVGCDVGMPLPRDVLRTRWYIIFMTCPSWSIHFSCQVKVGICPWRGLGLSCTSVSRGMPASKEFAWAGVGGIKPCCRRVHSSTFRWAAMARERTAIANDRSNTLLSFCRTLTKWCILFLTQ